MSGESPVNLLRQAAEAASSVLPASVAALAARELKNGLWWLDKWSSLNEADMEMFEATWGNLAREVLALAEQQRELPAHTWRVGDDPGADRALMVDAAEYVINVGLAAVTAVQRNIRVSFAKARQLLDLLETWGVVGPAEGSMAREVLVSKDELDDIVTAIRASGNGIEVK